MNPRSLVFALFYGFGLATFAVTVAGVFPPKYAAWAFLGIWLGGFVFADHMGWWQICEKEDTP